MNVKMKIEQETKERMMDDRLRGKPWLPCKACMTRISTNVDPAADDNFESKQMPHHVEPYPMSTSQPQAAYPYDPNKQCSLHECCFPDRDSTPDEDLEPIATLPTHSGSPSPSAAPSLDCSGVSTPPSPPPSSAAPRPRRTTPSTTTPPTTSPAATRAATWGYIGIGMYPGQPAIVYLIAMYPGHTHIGPNARETYIFC
ncbi:hypothetical protein B0H12DRAFT_1077129 [Mycena haematopus]|nr:hypothetical protein B0H12DRAFT_1077129 [Mycena haematopus]